MNHPKSALALSAALVLVACGGGGGSSSATAPDTAGTTPVAQAMSPAVSPTPSVAGVPPSSPSSAPSSSAVIANANTSARAVAVSSDGTRVAAWSDDSGVHSQLFDAQGRLVGGAVSVAATGRLTGVAALSGGGYAIEYAQPDAVLVQRADASGALTGAPATVRTQAQVEADLAGNMQPLLVGGAGVRALAGGGFAALYRTSHLAHIPGDYPGELVAQRYDAQGSAVGGPAGLASETPTAFAATASTPAGELVTAMTELCPCQGSGTALVTVQNGSLQKEGAFEKTPGDLTGSPSAAGLANGNFIAVWTVISPTAASTAAANQVQGQVFALDASTASGSRSITPVLTFADAVAGARVTALAGGGFLLSWGTAAQSFDAAGQPAGAVMQILDGDIAATPDGGFVVVAQVGSQLLARTYAGSR